MQCNIPRGKYGGLRPCLTISGSSRVRCIAFDCYAAAGQRLAGSTLRLLRIDKHRCIGGHVAPPAAAAPSRAAVVPHPSPLSPCMHALTNLRRHAVPAEARRCLPLQSGAQLSSTQVDFWVHVGACMHVGQQALKASKSCS